VSANHLADWPGQGQSGLVGAPVTTPLGELWLVASAHGLRAVSLPGEHQNSALDAVAEESRHSPGPSGSGDGYLAQGHLAQGHLARAQEQIAQYFNGERFGFDLELDPLGTPFQTAAWQALRTIPFGETWSYGAQAAAMGDRRKARAVGGANRRNPLPIIVPCHRVVGWDGRLTGYSGGLTLKSWLLEHERAIARVVQPSRA
jgi:methylated-DNA-[protein]-cysteine S-methyltransferase